MKRFLFTSIAMLFFTQLMISQSQCDPLEYNSNDVFLSLGPTCDLVGRQAFHFTSSIELLLLQMEVC